MKIKNLLFAVMTALFLLAATNLRAASSGKCGDNVKWSLSVRGVLTIEGTGAMYDYTFDSPAPWEDKSFTSAVIKDGVTTIGNDAFASCKGLTSVNIPNSVTSIGESAFSHCSGLTSVTIPGSVTSIGEWAFAWCEGLTSVTIPNSVTSIGEWAFCSCEGLTSVNIPNSVTSIGESAFAWCEGLTSVNIPGSVTSIGESAFAACTGLESITVAPENSIYDSRDNCNAIVETATNTMVAGCKNTSIPGTVTSIGEYAFSDCTGLTSVTIPNSVTSIGEYAFYWCTGLTKIESLAENPPVCDKYPFSGVNKDKCELSVPKNSVEAYKAAEGWKDFYNIVAGISGVAQDNDVGVSAKNGVISVTGVAGNAVVEVYSTGGAQVYRGTSKTVAVPSAGTYIVRAAGRTFKVNTAK